MAKIYDMVAYEETKQVAEGTYVPKCVLPWLKEVYHRLNFTSAPRARYAVIDTKHTNDGLLVLVREPQSNVCYWLGAYTTKASVI